MKKIYYNEFDKYAVQWLKNLIVKGYLPDGEIDDRSILSVKASDIKEFTECHFFAGIGGWPLAMQLANWQSNETVWTGSCPCQPFSNAGKKRGEQDERHLWPVWHELIKQCKPSVIFGEQVANAISFGWLDLVANDLEKESYQVGAAILPACSAGAPHKRDRLWFVAYPSFINDRGDTRKFSQKNEQQAPQRQEKWVSEFSCSDESFWSTDAEWICCADGKQRLIKSGIRLLANGVPARVGRLRAYGNAIVPQVAAMFIRASAKVLGI